MLQKSSAQFLGVNAKQDGNGIGDNVQVYYKLWIQFKTMLIPYATQCQNMVSTSFRLILMSLFEILQLVLTILIWLPWTSKQTFLKMII